MNKDIISNEKINFDEILQKQNEFNDTTELNKTLGSKNFVILHVNIRSLNENLNKLEVFVKSLNNKPSVILGSETWKIHHTQFFQIPGYKIFL